MIDLNRGKDEIDKEMFFNLPGDSFCNSNRVLSGIGLFPKLRGSEYIYKEKLDWLIFKKLIDNAYDVWHSKLEKEIFEVKTTFSDIVLLDCHSMPSLDINGYKINNLPDFVIGDLWGKTSKKEITQFLVDFLKKEGFKVSTNSPYAGAHILKKYGKPEKGINALQIEIRKDLYLDEKELSINENYNNIKRILQKMILNLSGLVNEKNVYQKSAE